jgi:phosphonopyruvate decarboxylase
MIEAQSFVEAARAHGFHNYAGIPCSFLTPFINYVINDDSLTYVSSANEGDALATAAGSAIGGRRAVVMMQNSGLGNAVSPATSLTWVFRIPVLIICTHRGAPGVKDEPQHELMGRITGGLFDLMQIPWEAFPDRESGIAPALQRAVDYMDRERRPYALIMQQGSVASHDLQRDPLPPRPALSGPVITPPAPVLPSRREILQHILGHSPEGSAVVLATTGYTGRELYALADRDNQLYMVGSMGCVSSLGLGLALARPDKDVIILDGDGAALMRMGNLATVGSYGGGNLVHILLDNGVHESTGAQATVSRNVDFAAVAAACGYGLSLGGGDPALIDRLFAADKGDRPRFCHIRIRPGTLDALPRPAMSPPEVVRRLMQHLETRF